MKVRRITDYLVLRGPFIAYCWDRPTLDGIQIETNTSPGIVMNINFGKIMSKSLKVDRLRKMIINSVLG